MHRVVAKTPDSLEPDHISTDKLDNRKENLRNVTHAENGQNRNHHSHRGGRPTSSRYKGVTWNRSRRCWTAQIRVNGRLLGLGASKSEEDCGILYNVAAQLFFGPYARLNMI